jgi:hypothetical protein
MLCYHCGDEIEELNVHGRRLCRECSNDGGMKSYRCVGEASAEFARAVEVLRRRLSANYALRGVYRPSDEADREMLRTLSTLLGSVYPIGRSDE